MLGNTLNNLIAKTGHCLKSRNERIYKAMSAQVQLFHNPNCSKSRATLELLTEKNIEPIIIEYLKTPLTKELIEDILQKLNQEPRDIMRKKEQPYIDYKLENSALGRTQLIAAIIKDPILLERPIVLANNKAVIGRPPELVLEII